MAFRILFAGSPAIAAASLEAAAGASLNGPWRLAGVLTNPDRRRGRSGQPEASEIAKAAGQCSRLLVQQGFERPVILKPETLGAEARKTVSGLKPDLLVCFAYGHIFGPKFLELFPWGGVNIHPSLLPKYRGASPLQEAILRRDAVTGICIQKIAGEMDSGNILAQREIRLSGRETTVSLSRMVSPEAASLLAGTLSAIADSGGIVPEGKPQEGEPSYCSLVGKDSGVIDWTKSAGEIDAMIRAYTPWPLARTACGGQVLYLLEAAPYRPSGQGVPGQVLGTDRENGILIQTGNGILAVSRLQYQARKALSWRDFLNGARDFTGSCLTEDA